LLCFLEPDAGRITVDGRPLGELARDGWRRQVGWAPQAPHLFHDTVAANIRLGRPEASMDEVMTAARQARLHDFVDSLPQGYETAIGEQGARLSGGQAQRLALARAFLKDAPLLILDEPASNLDPATEQELYTAMAGLLAGRTALIIAHRPATIALADRVVRLEGGRVVEPAPLEGERG
jgi:ABC-type multidrug transport system fused ATPase/permease subunit